jgi:AcrR family transcriptional regulator
MVRMVPPGKPATEPRIPLSRERVLRVAVAFADERGVGSLTMRKLGEAALGVEAMSLYKPRGQQGRAPRRHGRSV